MLVASSLFPNPGTPNPPPLHFHLNTAFEWSQLGGGQEVGILAADLPPGLVKKGPDWQSMGPGGGGRTNRLLADFCGNALFRICSIGSCLQISGTPKTWFNLQTRETLATPVNFAKQAVAWCVHQELHPVAWFASPRARKTPVGDPIAQATGRILNQPTSAHVGLTFL